MSPIWGVLMPAVISVVLTAPQNDIDFSTCTHNANCSSEQCCVLGPIRYAIPTCMPFQQRNEQCRVNAEPVTTNLTYPDNSQLKVKDVNYILCPCATGLSCDWKSGKCI